MASRFTVVKPVDFNIPVLQAPLELMAATLQDAQTSKDEYDKMIELMPKHLTEGDHVKFAEDYKALMGNIREGVSQAFASGDTGKALRMLQEAKGLIRKENTPGGLGHALETAYTTYQENLKQLEEKFKDDIKAGNNINYQYAKEKMKPVNLKYNYETGSYNLTPGSNVPTYFDVDKHLQEWLKTMKPSEYGFTQFSEDGKWLIDEEGKRYNAREMAMELMNDPRVQQQNQISADFSAMQMGEEGRNKYAEQLNQSMAMAKQQELETFGEISKMLASKNANDRKKGQAALASLGLAVDGKVYGKDDIDGQVGERTNKALAMVQEKINEPVTPYTGDDVSKLLYRELQTGIANKAEAALPDSRTLKWRANEYELIAERDRRQRAAMKEYLDLWASQNKAVIDLKTSSPLTLDAVNKAQEALGEAVSSAKMQLTSVIGKDNNLKQMLGLPQGNAVNVESAVVKLGAYAQALEDNNNNTAMAAQQLGVDKAVLDQVHAYLNMAQNAGIREAALNYAEASEGTRRVNEHYNQIKKVFIDQGKGNDLAAKFIKRNNLKNVTPEQLIANPEKYLPSEAATNYASMPSYSYFSNDVLDKNRGNKSELQQFKDMLNQRINTDIKENSEIYKTVIPKGFIANDEYGKMQEDNWTEYSNIPDENGSLAWKTSRGKKIENPQISESSVKMQFQKSPIKNGWVVVMTGRTTDGETVEKRSYIANSEKDAQLTSYASAALATALNNKNMTEAAMLTEMLYPYNPLFKIQADPTTAEAPVGTYRNPTTQEITPSTKFNVAASFPIQREVNGKIVKKGELALVAIKGNQNNVVWSIVDLPPDWRTSRSPVLTQLSDPFNAGNSGIYSDDGLAQTAFNLAKEVEFRTHIGTVRGQLQSAKAEARPQFQFEPY